MSTVADPGWDELVAAARQARARAYAPYSRFYVGAAVRGGDGVVYTGANVENASYGLAVCAERNAVMRAVFAGAKTISAVVVCTDLSPPAAPCGMCRQTLAEFALDCEIRLVGPEEASGATDAPDQTVHLRLEELLPRAFRPAALADYYRSHDDDDPKRR